MNKDQQWEMSPERLSVMKARAQSRHDFSVDIMEKLGNLFIGVGQYQSTGGLGIQGEISEYLAREMFGDYKQGTAKQKGLRWITGSIASEVAQESMVDDSIHLFAASIHGIGRELEGKVVDGPINAFIEYDICSSTWVVKYSVVIDTAKREGTDG